MGRGKIPKSTQLHIIAGTFRHDRHGGAGGGGDGDGRPPADQRLTIKDCPEYLDKRAAELWREALPKLPWLHRTDKYCFAMWCCLQAEYEQNPASMKAAKYSILRLLAGDLGLTAAGRARLGFTMAPPAEPDPYLD